MNDATHGPVTVVRPGEHQQAAAAIAAGHADYPAFRHLFPDPSRRARALRAFFAATVCDGIGFGTVLAVWDGPHVAATAVWLPPGAFPWTTRRKLAAVGALTRVLLADPRRFGAFVRCGNLLERAHPAEPHWYLVVLSVRPDHQRRGLGGALLAPILERSDRDHLPCYLETSDPANVAFYQRFGFRVSGTIAALSHGPVHTMMQRNPRGVAGP